jgi:hypothetical protein
VSTTDQHHICTASLLLLSGFLFPYKVTVTHLEQPNNAAACFHVGHWPSSLVSNVDVCVLRLPPLGFIADLIVPMAVAPAKSPTFQSSTQPHNSPTEMSSDFLAGCLHASIYCPKWVVSLTSCPFQTHRGLCLKRGRITPVSVTKSNLCWFARVPP